MVVNIQQILIFYYKILFHIPFIKLFTCSYLRTISIYLNNLQTFPIKKLLKNIVVETLYYLFCQLINCRLPSNSRKSTFSKSRLFTVWFTLILYLASLVFTSLINFSIIVAKKLLRNNF